MEFLFPLSAAEDMSGFESLWCLPPVAMSVSLLFSRLPVLVLALAVLECTGGRVGIGRLAEAFCWLGLLLPLLLLVAEEESEPVRRDSQCLPLTSS